MNFIKKILKSDFVLMLLVSALVTISFAVYLLLIGIPKTQARNHFNRGQIAEEKGDYATAKSEYEKALTYWKENYIERELESLKDRQKEQGN